MATFVRLLHEILKVRAQRCRSLPRAVRPRARRGPRDAGAVSVLARCFEQRSRVLAEGGGAACVWRRWCPVLSSISAVRVQIAAPADAAFIHWDDHGTSFIIEDSVKVSARACSAVARCSSV